MQYINQIKYKYMSLNIMREIAKYFYIINIARMKFNINSEKDKKLKAFFFV